MWVFATLFLLKSVEHTSDLFLVTYVQTEFVSISFPPVSQKAEKESMYFKENGFRSLFCVLM
jgi:hypothetical protein